MTYFLVFNRIKKHCIVLIVITFFLPSAISRYFFTRKFWFLEIFFFLYIRYENIYFWLLFTCILWQFEILIHLFNDFDAHTLIFFNISRFNSCTSWIAIMSNLLANFFIIQTILVYYACDFYVSSPAYPFVSPRISCSKLSLVIKNIVLVVYSLYYFHLDSFVEQTNRVRFIPQI